MNTVPRSSSHRGVLLGCLVSHHQRGADPPIPGDHSVLSSLTHHPSFDDRSWSHGQRQYIRPFPTNLITVNFPDLALSIPSLAWLEPASSCVRESSVPTILTFTNSLRSGRPPLNWTLAALSPGTPRLRMFNRPSIPPLTAIQCTLVCLLPSQFLSVCVFDRSHDPKNGGQTKRRDPEGNGRPWALGCRQVSML